MFFGIAGQSASTRPPAFSPSCSSLSPGRLLPIARPTTRYATRRQRGALFGGAAVLRGLAYSEVPSDLNSPRTRRCGVWARHAGLDCSRMLIIASDADKNLN